MTDSIADLLTRIRNANTVFKETVEIPTSKMKWEMVNLLKKEGFIRECIIVPDEKGHKNIKVTLKYGRKQKRVISGVKRISKSGCRIYSSVKGLKKYHKEFGVTLLSTPKGILTDKASRQAKVGGEVLCMVW